MSIVSWVKRPDTVPTPVQLDGVPVPSITTSLTAADGSGGWTPATLPTNRGRCFQGPIPVGGGFILADDEARSILARTDADYRRVVRPYLTSSDIAEDSGQRPSRWIIDFAQKPLEAARGWPEALKLVRDRVRPFRETVRREGHRVRWWQFGEPRVGMRRALEPLNRYIAGGRHGKRMTIAWVDPWTMASDATNVFAIDDDYSMGVLLSRAHTAWAWARSSTLKGDLRYTPSSVFLTFPWPEPTDVQRVRVSAAAVALYEHRSARCQEHGIGLTKLYNLMDDGAFTELAALHRELDEAVTDAYGWPSAVAQDDAALVQLLTTRNKEISEGTRPYTPFD